jgi:hypothetical protein
MYVQAWRWRWPMAMMGLDPKEMRAGDNHGGINNLYALQ